MQHLEIALSETNRVEIQRAYTLVGNSNRAIAVFNKETPKEQKPFFDAALAAHKKSCDIATGLQDTLMASTIAAYLQYWLILFYAYAPRQEYRKSIPPLPSSLLPPLHK